MLTTQSKRQGWITDDNLDLSLHPIRDEFLKIETVDIPKLSANTKPMNGGEYCYTNKWEYKNCQRQRKRPCDYDDDLTPCRITDKSLSSPEMSSFSSSSSFASMLSPLSPPSTPLFSPLQRHISSNRTQRKKPSLRSYEKHLPKPVYSQGDSIYRVEDNNSDIYSIKDQEKNSSYGNNSNKSSPTLSSVSSRPLSDKYEISWKDEAGDDMLPSLVTFTTIIEEKGDENPEGLSDFLEQRTKELKDRKYSQKITSSISSSPIITTTTNHHHHYHHQLSVLKLPPHSLNCMTLSYRIGPKHEALTLFDTMKLSNRFDRMYAYSTAFKECIGANTGLKEYVTKNRSPPIKERSKLVPIARKPTLKRSLLYPLSPSLRKNKTTEDSAVTSPLVETPVSLSVRNLPFEISSPIQNNNETITSVINNNTKNNGLFPSMTQFKNINPNKEQQQADFLNRSYSDLKDTSSISSSDSSKASQTRRPSRLLSSLGRKASTRSHKSSSNRSVDNEQCSPSKQTFH